MLTSLPSGGHALSPPRWRETDWLGVELAVAVGLLENLTENEPNPDEYWEEHEQSGRHPNAETCQGPDHHACRQCDVRLNLGLHGGIVPSEKLAR